MGLVIFGEKQTPIRLGEFSDHQAHHQGQIIVYLRLNGIKPPEYVGW